MRKMTKEELKNCIHEMDMLLRPFVLFINPANESIIKEALKDINREDDFLIKTTESITRNKIIVMERKELEKYCHPDPPINQDHITVRNCSNCRFQPGPLLMCAWMREKSAVYLKCPRWEARTK